MSVFVHNGVEITLNESSGKFSAAINGERVTSASLSAIKKKIDKPAEFQPFPAIVMDFGGAKDVFIVRKKKLKAASWRAKFSWVDDKGREYGAVIPSTQEAKDAIAKWKETRDRNKAEIERLNDEIDEAREAIPAVPFE
jgi:hypothetical protein